LRDLVDAVASLPERQREAIVMRELEGRSYEEIAASLGASDGAVRGLLMRARSAIRQRIAAIPGLDPVLQWFAGTGNGAGAARIGALSGGCAIAAKVCTAVVLPVIPAGIGALAISPGHSQARTVAGATAPARSADKGAANNTARTRTARP